MTRSGVRSSSSPPNTQSPTLIGWAFCCPARWPGLALWCGWATLVYYIAKKDDRPFVVLTDYQAALVEQLVSSGRYQNASEVLRDGLRLVEQREAEDASRLVALRNAVRVGVADFGANRFATFESSKALSDHLNSVASKAMLKLLHDSMDLARHLPTSNDQSN